MEIWKHIEMIHSRLFAFVPYSEMQLPFATQPFLCLEWIPEIYKVKYTNIFMVT